MFKAHAKYKYAFSLIETVVAVAIFSGVSLALFSSFKQVMKVVRKAQVRAVMATVAAEQLEIIRNLPFSDVGTISGIPNGVIPQNKVLSRGGSNFSITTVIRNIDLSFDGVAPADTSPADNKLAQISIVCTSCDTGLSSSYSTQFGPKDLEGISTNGSLFIRTIDASGQPVPAAAVSVKVDPPDTVVDLLDSTGINGILQLVGAAPAKNAYMVTVSKTGYTSDRTYSNNGPETTKPVIPHATVDEGVVTQLTFVIDRVSTVNVSSVSPTCAPIPSVPFKLTGTKIIGYEPVYKYIVDLATNNGGLQTIENFEWDTYKVETSKSGYNLIGVIPSPQFVVTPGTTQSLQLVLLKDETVGQNDNTIAVSVKDGVTGAQLSGVDVRFEHSFDTIENITGRGQLVQSDWSSGSGQEMYEDIRAYDTDDGNVSIDTVPGTVELKKFSGQYALYGELISSIIDTGSPSNFYEFRYSPTSQPAGTNIQFQLATSNSTSGPFMFIGPDGTASSTYTTDSSVINPIHNNNKYIKYKMFLSTTNTAVTPTVEDVTFSFTSACLPPGQTYAQSIHNGSWEITLSKDGYETQTDRVTVNGEKVWVQLNYILNPI